jgi:hypothetical protein
MNPLRCTIGRSRFTGAAQRAGAAGSRRRHRASGRQSARDVLRRAPVQSAARGAAAHHGGKRPQRGRRLARPVHAIGDRRGLLLHLGADDCRPDRTLSCFGTYETLATWTEQVIRGCSSSPAHGWRAAGKPVSASGRREPPDTGSALPASSPTAGGVCGVPVLLVGVEPARTTVSCRRSSP